MEELRILDKELNLVAFVDNFESFIWTDRFEDCGDFELVLPANAEVTDYIKLDYFLQNPKSESIMIIESIDFKSEEGVNKVTVKGRSAESLLERRIIWGNKSFTNENIKNVITTLLNENIISPTNIERKIKLINLKEIDKNILPTILSAQYEGENLLETLRDLCTSKEIGIKAKIGNNNRKSDGKWKWEKYAKQGATYPTPSTVDGLNVTDTRYFNDVDCSISMNISDNYTAKCTTYVYCNEPYTFTGTCSTDDNGSLYINDEFVINIGSCTVVNFTYNFKMGVNKIEVCYTEGSGGDGWSVLPRLSQDEHIAFMSSNPNDLEVYKSIDLYFYKGQNRSRIQTKNSPVMFSDFFDNLNNSTYYESLVDYKNVALVGGEENGTSKTYGTFGTADGLDRREIYVDGSDLSRTQSSGTLTVEQYKAQLAQKGREELVDYSNQIAADSEVATLSTTFKYGFDYEIGDVVQVIDPYQHNFCARVAESIYSRDNSEEKTYPSFSYIKDFEVETIEYEGETYAHLFHHFNNTNAYLFQKELDFTDEVKMDENRWSKMHLIPYLNHGDKFKFLVRQANINATTPSDYIWEQDLSPWDATFEDVAHANINPILNIPSAYGGVYFVFNSQTYADAKAAFIFNNGTKTSWWSIGGWTTNSGGQPCYAGATINGYCDLYLKIY